MNKKEPEMGGEKVKIKLNYILDELKNIKVAKGNAKRPMETKKITIDEVNVRLNLNSAMYLVSKEELMKLPPGDTTT